MKYCLITDRHTFRHPFERIAEYAEAAEIDYVQLREKDLTSRELLEIAHRIRPILRHARLIINGQLDVALACAADGVHLQKGNLPVRAVRRKFPALVIGYSAHSPEEIERAEVEGASYIFLSPVFPPRSKGSDLQAIGIPKFTEWIRRSRIPVFALGGIEEANLAEVQTTGCAGVAAISLFANRL